VAESNGQRYLRASQVADIFHVARSTVGDWARAGKLPFTRTLGGRRLYPEGPIRELAASLHQDTEADR
jgi:excisionase family DNA binding protein